MPYFKTKVHQIRFRPPSPVGGAHSAPPHPYGRLKLHTSFLNQLGNSGFL